MSDQKQLNETQITEHNAEIKSSYSTIDQLDSLHIQKERDDDQSQSPHNEQFEMQVNHSHNDMSSPKGKKVFKCTTMNAMEENHEDNTMIAQLNNNALDKPYKCTFPNCGLSYRGLSRLNIHLRTHTGEKPFKCKFEGCGKSFNEKGNLKTHVRIHTGEKPFVCPFQGCISSFKAKGQLAYHIKSHSKTKPFNCSICLKRFTRLSTLKTHSFLHTRDNINSIEPQAQLQDDMPTKVMKPSTTGNQCSNTFMPQIGMNAITSKGQIASSTTVPTPLPLEEKDKENEMKQPQQETVTLLSNPVSVFNNYYISNPIHPIYPNNLPVMNIPYPGGYCPTMGNNIPSYYPMTDPVYAYSLYDQSLLLNNYMASLYNESLMKNIGPSQELNI